MDYRNCVSGITISVFSLTVLINLLSVPAWSFQISQPGHPGSSLRSSAPISIHGHVTDESGNAMADVTFTIKWTERTTRSNQNGEFAFENISEKDTIEVNHPGYQNFQFPIQRSKINYFITLKATPKQASSSPSSTVRKVNPAPSKSTGETMDIAGKIYDDKGTGLADAFLIINGSDQGGFSDGKGEFQLKSVPINSTVVISHISFISKQFKVLKSQVNYEQTLTKDLKQLDEVVVVGYQTIRCGSSRNNSVPSTPKLPEKEFVVVEQNPEFPGGTQALYKFLGQNIKYPSEASQSNISGRAYVSFTVDANGNIRKPQIVKGLGFGIDEEVLRVVLNMPKWLPARQNGKAVSKEFALPIAFALE